jgi:hypothetical protein
LGEVLKDSSGDLLRLRQVDASAEDNKFIASQASHEVGLAHRGYEPLCDLIEKEVADMVS